MLVLTLDIISLWTSLKGRCLESIVSIRTTTDELSLRRGDPPILFNLYAYVALIQIYWAVLELPPSDSGLSSTLDVALSLLRSMRLETSNEISTVLIHPLFTIGCLVNSAEDRHLIGWGLTRIGKEHGKANAMFAKGLLQEVWSEADIERRPVRQGDVDRLTSKSTLPYSAVALTDAEQSKKGGTCRYGDRRWRVYQAAYHLWSAFDAIA